ncbi:MAG: YkgJ family cysteine cluster protein [Paraclostridium sp.]
MRKINFDFIPPHLNCNNCGGCCGPVPISEREYKLIYDYCIENNVVPILYLEDYTCPFRDNKKKVCLIYEVRPTICKLFGVSEGMECDNGNTYNMNGYKYILKDPNKDLNGMNKLVADLVKGRKGNE